MTSFTRTTTNYPVDAATAINRIIAQRDPLSGLNGDRYNFNLGDEWLNKTNNSWWKLANKTATTALWLRIGSFPSDVEGLVGNTGGAVLPNGSGLINTLGDGTSINIAGNPGTSTLTASVLLPAANDVLYSVSTSPETIGGISLNNLQVPVGITSSAPVPATLTAGSGITINYTSGTPNRITFSASATSLNYTSVNHAASPYTVMLTDQYISVDCSGGTVTLKFPDNPGGVQVWSVKDRTGSASTNNITLTTVTGTDTFDGVTSYLLKGNYDANNLIFNGSNYEVF